MNKKIIITLISFNILFLSVLSINPVESSEIQEYNMLPYNQELDLPIFKETELIKNQPIDVRINFTYYCWALNEKQHSIRVIYKDPVITKELESQIYDLEFLDDDHFTVVTILSPKVEEVAVEEEELLEEEAEEAAAEEEAAAPETGSAE